MVLALLNFTFGSRALGESLLLLMMMTTTRAMAMPLQPEENYGVYGVLHSGKGNLMILLFGQSAQSQLQINIFELF